MQHLIKPTNPPLNACKIFTSAAAENMFTLMSIQMSKVFWHSLYGLVRISSVWHLWWHGKFHRKYNRRGNVVCEKFAIFGRSKWIWFSGLRFGERTVLLHPHPRNHLYSIEFYISYSNNYCLFQTSEYQDILFVDEEWKIRRVPCSLWWPLQHRTQLGPYAYRDHQKPRIPQGTLRILWIHVSRVYHRTELNGQRCRPECVCFNIFQERSEFWNLRLSSASLHLRSARGWWSDGRLFWNLRSKRNIVSMIFPPLDMTIWEAKDKSVNYTCQVTGNKGFMALVK